MQIIQCVTSHCIMNFEKNFIYLMVVKPFNINESGIVVNHNLCTYKCSFSYFLLLYNKQSYIHSLYNAMSQVVLFAYPIKLNISTKNRVTINMN